MRLEPSLVDELFAIAARAPSAHNTQPWVPHLVDDGDADSPAEVILRVDPGRTLPRGDPRSEDLHLAMGCWVESFAIAAAEAGLSTRMIAVTGRAETLRIRIEIDSGADPAAPNGRAAPPVPDTSRVSGFGTADLRHRQVDRGRLARAQADFAEVRQEIEAELADHGAHLVEVPHALWTRLQARASRYALSVSPIVDETLEWLRFDPRDPRYFLDGLTTECLRVPPVPARLAAEFNRAAMRPLVARIIATVIWPARALDRYRRLSAATSTSTEAEPDPGLPPQHVVLAVTAARHETPAARTEGEIDLGRLLLRTWLRLDRAGLRVDVHSEIKDCPETQEVAARLGERHLAGPIPENQVPDTPVRVFSAFSLGRSMTAVPRSHRRPADQTRS